MPINNNLNTGVGCCDSSEFDSSKNTDISRLAAVMKTTEEYSTEGADQENSAVNFLPETTPFKRNNSSYRRLRKRFLVQVIPDSEDLKLSPSPTTITTTKPIILKKTPPKVSYSPSPRQLRKFQQRFYYHQTKWPSKITGAPGLVGESTKRRSINKWFTITTAGEEETYGSQPNDFPPPPPPPPEDAEDGDHPNYHTVHGGFTAAYYKDVIFLQQQQQHGRPDRRRRRPSREELFLSRSLNNYDDFYPHSPPAHNFGGHFLVPDGRDFMPTAPYPIINIPAAPAVPDDEGECGAVVVCSPPLSPIITQSPHNIEGKFLHRQNDLLNLYDTDIYYKKCAPVDDPCVGGGLKYLRSGRRHEEKGGQTTTPVLLTNINSSAPSSADDREDLKQLQPTYETDGNILIMNDSPKTAGVKGGGSGFGGMSGDDEELSDLILHESLTAEPLGTIDLAADATVITSVAASNDGGFTYQHPMISDDQSHLSPRREGPVVHYDVVPLHVEVVDDSVGGLDPRGRVHQYKRGRTAPVGGRSGHSSGHSHKGESTRPEDALLEKVTYLLTLHPKYFDKFYRAHSFLMKGAGPVKYSDRNYVAYIAAARFKCHALMDNQAREFIDNGGDPSWLAHVKNVNPKFQMLHYLNKIMAHQPWLIDKYLIQRMIKSQDIPQYNWSLSELVFALTIMSHIQSLCTLVYGCSWLYDLNDGSTNDLNEVPLRYCQQHVHSDKLKNEPSGSDIDVLGVPEDVDAAFRAGSRTHHLSSNEGSISSGEELIPIGVDVTQIENLEETEDVTVDNLIVKMKNLHQQLKAQQKNMGSDEATASEAELVLRYEKVVESSVDRHNLKQDISNNNLHHHNNDNPKTHNNYQRAQTYLTAASSSDIKPNGENEAFEKEETKKLNFSQLEKYETSILEHKLKVQAAANLSARLNKDATASVLNAKDTIPSSDLKASFQMDYLEDPEFCYVDFAKRDCPSRAPTFRYQDYSWEQHGFSLVSRFCNELSPLLDDKFKTAYHLTYSTMGNVQNVDTSMFRRAIWNYVHCMYGIRYDDYDYAQVNQLLARNLKRIVKILTCYPERLTNSSTLSNPPSQHLSPLSLTPPPLQAPSSPLPPQRKSRPLQTGNDKKNNKVEPDNKNLNNNTTTTDTSTTAIIKDHFMSGFLESEKVHVNLMIMEAKLQAQMLYGLRAIMQYVAL